MNADIKAKKCRFDLCIGYEWRIHRVTKKSQCYEALNIEVQYSKKRLSEDIENQWIVLSLLNHIICLLANLLIACKRS